MNREVISDKQGICIMILFIWGSTLVLGTGGPAKSDAWIAVLLGGVLSAIPIYIYSRILTKFPGRDIFDINEIVLGKVLGKIINFLYIIFAIHLCALVFDNFGEFINIVGLPDTPRLAPIIPLTIICVWIVKEGIECLGRFCEIFLLVLMIILCITIILSVNEMDVNNIRPLFFSGKSAILKGTFLAFSFPFAETVIFTMILSSVKTKKSPFKIYFTALPIAGLILVILTLRNVLVSGTELISLNYFPSYFVVGRISIGEFIQRIETFVAIGFLISGFTKMSVCLLAASNGISKVFGFKDYRFIVTPVALFILSMSFMVYESIIETVKWVPKYYPAYAFIFEVILPLITFAAVKLNKSKST